MNENDVLKIVLGRLGAGAAIPSITNQLAGVLIEISSRADFLTAESAVNTVAGQSSYDLPGNFKNIYEVVFDSQPLDKLTYREFLALGDGDGLPAAYSVRHEKLYLWPTPEQAVAVTLDGAVYHPRQFIDILFEDQFHETIIEGILAQLWREKNPDKADSENPHKTAFETGIETLIASLDAEPAVVEYREI
jgi:hypothetical protein